MASQTSSIPLTMAFKKFYCHTCGGRLVRSPRTRTVKPGDPDHGKYSRMGGHTHVIGAVEVTEYDFRCLSCDTTVGYDEQCVIDRVQKRVGKSILSQAELDENREAAEASVKKARKIRKLITAGISIAFAVLILYLWLSSGDFSFTVHF